MARSFDCFVVFAEMRTGSNFLESNLNAIDGVICHGEAFNPHFIGYPTTETLLGLTQGDRDADPLRLLGAIRTDPGRLGGFRYFHDHDPRIFDHVIEDARCAKIVLTRNPLDSYVSWKIAQATGQWKLTNVQKRKEAQAVFDADEFTAHVEALQEFQVRILNRLQRSGQTAFYVAYEDLQSVEVMNGLAQWLGVRGSLDGLSKTLKRQNPEPVVDKVSNPAEMARAISRLDRFNLTRTPNFEPRRGAATPAYVAAARAPLLFMPIKGGPELSVEDWLAGVDGVGTGDLIRDMTQRDLKLWMRDRPGHRRFTVLAHPLERAHRVFCERILSTGPAAFGRIRRILQRSFDLSVPETMPDPSYGPDRHRAAFETFLTFLRANLAGQTTVRVDAAWAGQAQVLQGYSEVALPDEIIRPHEMAEALPRLAAAVGGATHPVPIMRAATPVSLQSIHDRALEALVQDIYQRDYQLFGFRDWTPDQAA